MKPDLPGCADWFRYREVGWIDGWPKNCRSRGEKTHAGGAAGNPLRKICARIYSGNEHRPSALCEAPAQSWKASNWRDRCTAPWTNELESENKNTTTPRCRADSANITAKLIFAEVCYFCAKRPIISIGLSVVGSNPSNRVHTCGMPDAMVFT